MIGNSFHYANHEPSRFTEGFFSSIAERVLNLVDEHELDPKRCSFVGNNDIILFRDSEAALIVFSRSTHAHMPTVGDFDVTQGDTDIGQIDQGTPVTAPRRRVLSDQELEYLNKEYHFFRPISIVFPTEHMTSTERQGTVDAIAELLIEPTLEDIDRENRIVKVNPIFQGRDFLLDPDLVFVLMDFADEYTRIYNTLIKPTVEAEGFRCVRSDDIFRATAVMEDIWENINKAILILAEISGNNPNVMYELGICHTVGKEVMMLTQDASEIPFNFRHLRVYPYKNDIPGSEELKRNISSFLQQTRARQQANT